MGSIERVSMGLGGAEANGDSRNAVMSEDGHFIVFESDASNLVAGDTNNATDIFRYDTQTGDIVRVSVGIDGQANAASANASISEDGRYVVFDTAADNLTADDTNGLRDVFMRDVVTGVTTRVSERVTDPATDGQAEGVPGSYGSHNATIMTINGDQYVSFVSDATNLISGDTNTASDIFLRVMDAGAVYRVSLNNGGSQSMGFSGPSVAMDYFPGLTGPLYVFASQANLTSNAVPSDGGPLPPFAADYPDIAGTDAFKLYISDSDGNMILVSLQSGSAVQVGGHSFEPSLTYPYIAYTNSGDETGLFGVPDNGFTDILVYNHQTQTLKLASMGLNGEAANGASFNAHVLVADDNTPWVTFSSAASNLVVGDTNGHIDFFARNLFTNETIRISDPGLGVVSDGDSYTSALGGRTFSGGHALNDFVYAFTSTATNMVAGDTNGVTDIFYTGFRAPVVAASGGTAIVTEQVGSVIDAGLTVDSAHLTQASVQITGNYIQGQDFLQYTTVGTISGTFNATTGTLTLSGRGNKADYEAALRSVRYLNNADAPGSDRTISFELNNAGALSGIATRTVSINPVNDAPTNIVLAGSSVQEARATNTMVGTLSTVDPDAGSTFTYTLLDDAGGRFAIVGNQLRVADGVLLDFEQETSHQVQVRVTDNGGLTHTQTFTIAVTDVNPETVTGNSAANTMVGGSGNDRLSGLGGSDILIGNGGNDILDGGADTVLDVLIGGLGNDTYVLGASTNDIVVESAGNTNGIDTVTSTITRALTGQLADIENLTLLGGTAAINGTGNAMINVIVGNEGSNVLDGGALGDTLLGNGGDDVFLYANQANFIGDTVNGGAGLDRIRFTSTIANDTLTLSNKVSLVEVAEIANAAGLTSGTVALNLNAAAMAAGMQLIGNNGANTIIGTSFADIITGNGGIDTLTGGLGNDTYYLDNAADRVVEGAGGGADRVYTSVSYALAAGVQVETLQFTNAALTTALNLTGNEFAQTLIGNAGVNVLNGLGGADTMQGGLGNDTYFVDIATDRIIEAVGGGADRVFTSVSYALAAGSQVETLQFASPALTTAFNLTGNEFAQTLIGNAGVNVLNGGAGSDTLTGGAGADFFVFNTALGASNVDRLTDFTSADTIRLENAIFTGLVGVGTLTAAQFVSNTTGAAANANQHIIYETDTGNLYYDSNGSAAGGSVLFAHLSPGLALTSADFVII